MEFYFIIRFDNPLIDLCRGMSAREQRPYNRAFVNLLTFKDLN